jgi:hypothetical protein
VSACELNEPLPHQVIDLLLDDDSFLSVIPADDFVGMRDHWPVHSSSQKREHDPRRVEVAHSSPGAPSRAPSPHPAGVSDPNATLGSRQTGEPAPWPPPIGRPTLGLSL